MKTKIDIAIIPVIGVDRELKRIGHGQGFYDRFFENLNYKPLVIFAQSINAISEKKLTQEHDIAGEFYINPYKKYYKKDNKYDRITYRTYNRYSRSWNRIFSCKKINDAKYEIFVEQAKAKAKAIEYEAELILKDAKNSILNAELEVKKIRG